MATNKPVQTCASKETTDGSDSKKENYFTLTVNNQLREPTFKKNAIMKIQDENNPLIRYMEKAVDEKNGPMEKFTVKYFPRLGYFIEGIYNDNCGIYADGESYWQIRTESGKVELGISSFKPKDGMKVLLDLIIRGTDDHCI